MQDATTQSELRTLHSACNCARNCCGPGRFKFERNEASRDPCHRDDAGGAATAKGARQSVGWCGPDSQDRGSCGAGSGSRGGDHHDTGPWCGRAG